MINIVVLSLIIFVACDKKTTKKNLQINDSIVFYYSDDNKIKNIYKRTHKDSIFLEHYDKEGNLKSYGMLNKSLQKIGIWKYITDSLFIKNQYLIINGNSYLNKSIQFDLDSNLVGKNFFTHNKIKDTIYKNEKLFVSFLSDHPLYGRSKLLRFCLVKPKKGSEFNDDFSNINDINTDTVCSSPDKKIEGLPKGLSHLLVEDSINFISTGDHKLKLILMEVYNNETGADTVSRKYRHLYYTKNVFVKDTLDEF